VSSESEHQLVEAVCLLSGSQLVAACRAFVTDLGGDHVGPEFAKSLSPVLESTQKLRRERQASGHAEDSKGSAVGPRRPASCRNRLPLGRQISEQGGAPGVTNHASG
jgi:hypothetical protein